MNYYERHLGDYARDTAHLSMLEHGAYGLLLDRYYATEQGIPADQAHRISRARSKEEKAAVDAVLEEFFSLADGVWTHSRVDAEIAKARKKIEAARNNGKGGGRPKKNPEGTEEKPTGFSLGSDPETQTKALQTPDTKHQTPEIPPTTPPTVAAGGDEVQTQGHTPTPAGLVCRELRRAGIADTNPGHPRLLALLSAGATVDEFTGFAAGAVTKGSGFAWILAAVENERTRAASMQVHKGDMPRRDEQKQVSAAPTEAEAKRWLAEQASVTQSPEAVKAGVEALKALQQRRLTA